MCFSRSKGKESNLTLQWENPLLLLFTGLSICTHAVWKYRSPPIITINFVSSFRKPFALPILSSEVTTFCKKANGRNYWSLPTKAGCKYSICIYVLRLGEPQDWRHLLEFQSNVEGCTKCLLRHQIFSWLTNMYSLAPRLSESEVSSSGPFSGLGICPWNQRLGFQFPTGPPWQGQDLIMYRVPSSSAVLRCNPWPSRCLERQLPKSFTLERHSCK